MTEIQSVRQLANAGFEDIEFAHVKLKHPENGHYEQGRIVERFENDLTLRYRGNETVVTNVDEWVLRAYEPVRTAQQRQLIRADMVDGGGS